MATCTHRVTTPDTGNTPNTSGAFSPAVGDLLVVFVTKEASAPETPMVSADLTSSVAPTGFTLIRTEGHAFGSHHVGVFVATALTTNTTSRTVTIASGADAGAGTNISVFSVSGMTRVGSAAVRQSGGQADQSAGTPAPAFGAAALTGNPCLGCIYNATNPAGLTQPSGWSEGSDTGYTTGTVSGIETCFRDSGETGTTITWGSSSASAFASIIIELDTSGYTITVVDSLGMSNPYQRVSDGNRTHSDTLGAQEVVLNPAQWNRAYAEVLAMQEVFLRVTPFGRNPIDQLGSFDVYDRTSDGVRTYSDAQGHSDAYQRVADGVRSFVESAGFADAYQRLADALRSLADNLGLAEVVDLDLITGGALTISVIEMLGLRDPPLNRTAEVTLNLPRENLGVVDAILRMTTGIRVYTDSQGHSDAYARTSDGVRAFADSIGFADAYQRLSDALRNFTDLLGLIDVAALQLIGSGAFTLQAIESLGAADSFSRVSDGVRQFVEALGLVDVYARIADASRVQTDSLGTTDDYSRTADANRSYAELAAFLDTTRRVSDAAREFADDFGLTDAVVVQLIGAGVYTLAISELLGVADIFSRVSAANRQALDSLAFIDAVSRTVESKRSVQDLAGIQDEYQRLADAFRLFVDDFGFDEETVVNHLAFGAFTLQVIESLGSFDRMDRVADALRVIIDEIGLDELALVVWSSSVFQTGDWPEIRVERQIRTIEVERMDRDIIVAFQLREIIDSVMGE